MSYHTYTTDAIVCGSRERGAADRVYWLFTRDAGMVVARAKSVRESRSKLRYGLQDFSRVKVSMIRGKYDWKLVGAEPDRNLFFATESRASRGALLRAVKILRRVLPGEEAHPALFEMVTDGLLFFASRDLPDSSLEQVFIVRLLHRLGYVAPHPVYTNLLHAPTLEEACEDVKDATVRSAVARVAHDALTATQL